MAHRRRNPARRQASGLLYVLTGFFFLGACATGLWTVLVFLNPYGPWNPLPPPTPIPTVTPLFSPTPPLITLPPAPTPTPTATPTPTPSPTPTQTPVPTPTPTPSPTPTATPAVYPFILQEGSPRYLPAANLDPQLTCDWLGVAGVVVDPQNNPVPGRMAVIVLGQMPNGEFFQGIGVVGTANLNNVGGLSSGFMVQISSQPFDSVNAFTAQLYDLDTGSPLSPPVPFDTFASCDKNAVFLVFQKQP